MFKFIRQVVVLPCLVIAMNGDTTILNTNFGKCMLCGESEFAFVHKLRDDDKRNVFKCASCGHVQIVPLPSAGEDYEFYQSGKMYERSFKNPSEINNNDKLANRMRAFVEYQPRKLINYLHADWKILEIGSAFGWLVQNLSERGYDIEGVEISDECRNIYRIRTGKDLLSFNFLTDEPGMLAKYEHYDCICAFHTLEHITDPVTFLTRAAKLLKPGGFAYIEVPNHDDYMLQLSGKYAEHYYARIHVSYYSPATLSLLLEKSGFENVSVTGNQIYSPENVLQWLRYGEPFLEYHQIDLPEPIQWLNKIYKDRVESELKSCAIIGMGTKK